MVLVCFLDFDVLSVHFVDGYLFDGFKHLAIIVYFHIRHLLGCHAISQATLFLIWHTFKLIITQYLNNFECLLRQIYINCLPRLLCKAFDTAHFLLGLLSHDTELHVILLDDEVATVDFGVGLDDRINGPLDLDVSNTAPDVVQNVFNMLQTCCFYWLNIAI